MSTIAVTSNMKGPSSTVHLKKAQGSCSCATTFSKDLAALTLFFEKELLSLFLRSPPAWGRSL